MSKAMNMNHDAPSQNKHNNPWHGIGRLAKNVGHGVQGHVKRWKKEQDRKKLESHIAIVHKARQDMETMSGAMKTSPSLSSLGDIGMTLFSPLDGHFQELVNSDGDCTVDHEKIAILEPDAVTLDDSDDDDNDVLVLADGTEHESPLLLTIDIMRQLRQAMPTPVQLKIWKRLYSVQRDGDSFRSFTNSVMGHRQTLLVIQTLRGEIFGGFADAHWGNLTQRNDGCYHGTGRSFLFSTDSPVESLSPSPSSTAIVTDDHVEIFPWQGVNEYSILCSANDGGRLAMGGGGANGSFGFCVQDHFTKGSSGPCATFGNTKPLSSLAQFEVVNFEVYGFVNIW
jgi:hypothetical protein